MTVVIKDYETAKRFTRETPLSEAVIKDAAQAVRDEGPKAWAWIEPLAGLLFPRVEAAIKRELAIEGMR